MHRQGSNPEPIEPVVGEDRYQRFNTANNLVDVILGQDKNGSPGEVGFRVVEILDAAYRSAKQDGQADLVEDLYEA